VKHDACRVLVDARLVGRTVDDGPSGDVAQASGGGVVGVRSGAGELEHVYVD
jgi:hypothetical protein